MPQRNANALAAIDLGSNSFHMVIASQDADGSIRLIDKVKETVRLGAGLGSDGVLSESAQERALSCLKRFRQRLNNIPSPQIRAVGTNTMRAAHNGEEFLRLAEEHLGHHISIISGHEEARLVYLGAAFSLAVRDTRRLVVDIGGGSTEAIIGEGFKPIDLSSLYMGCVSFTRRFFSDGEITRHSLLRAQRAAEQELEPIVTRYRRRGWDQVVGTSGTIRAIDNLGRALGGTFDWIGRDSLAEVRRYLLDGRQFEKLDLLSERRREVIAGGYAILQATIDALDIERMEATDGALREGVLYDLNGRLRDKDSREQGVRSLMSQFRLDNNQINRVENTALYLYRQLRADWNLDRQIHEKLLRWASALHEVGFAIAYNQHHKHGAYIIENSDLDGFSRFQQRLLALMVRTHRQKFPYAVFEPLPSPWHRVMPRLAAILRIAVALNRSRNDSQNNDLDVHIADDTLVIRIARSWAESHPLSLLDLESEQRYLQDSPVSLHLVVDA
ncbi:MAG: Ppx/GppA phosphatase family protein [Pseudomonadota bacterium]